MTTVNQEPRELSDDDIPFLKDTSFDGEGRISAIQDADGVVHVNDHLVDSTDDSEEEEDENQDDQAKEKDEPAKPVKKNATNANGAPALPGQEDEPADGEESSQEYLNDAHYVLSQLSFEGDKVDLGNGIIKPIADLTTEEELIVMRNSFDDLREFHLQEIENQAQHPDRVQDEDEAALVNMKRAGLSMRQIAEEIIKLDPLAGKDNETLARLNLKEKYPNDTEEEIDEHLEFAKQKGKIDKLSDDYKSKMKDADSRALTEAQQQRIAQEQQLEIEEDLRHGELVITYMSQTNELAGYAINDEVKEYLAQQMLPAKPGSLSPLMADLQTPEGLAEVAFWKTYGKVLLEARYNEGLREGRKIADKFSDKPIVNSSAQRKNTGKKYEADVEKLSTVTHIGTLVTPKK